MDSGANAGMGGQQFDSGTAGTGGQAMDALTPTPTLRIVSPSATAYTKGTIQVQVEIANATPETVTLLADGAPIATISHPFLFAWDTTTVAEGEHRVTGQISAGGVVYTSAERTIVVDRTAPTVVSRTMLQHDNGVKLSSPIKVLFSEPMAASSITQNTISFQANGASVPVTVTLGADSKTATITINNRRALTLPASFEGTISPEITDLAGNKLTIPATPWTWLAPAVFHYSLAANSPSTVPQLAIGPALEPCVVYAGGVTPASIEYVINVAIWGGPQKWIQLPPPTTRKFSGSTLSLSLAIALDDKGHPIVAWEEDGDLRVAFWNGDAWDTPLPRLDGDGKPSTPVSNTRLALGPTGQLFVAWQENVGSGFDIFVARATGNTWDKSYGSLGLPVLVEFANLADLIVDGDGAPRIGWGGNGGPGGVSVWGGTTWSTKAPAGAIDSQVSARLDETGAPLAIQAKPALTVVRLVADEWQSAFPAFSAESFVFPTIAIGHDHRPAVAWIDQDAGVLNLGRWVGNAWDMRAGATIVERPGGIGFSLMQVDPQGNMWVRWMSGYPNVAFYMSNY